MGEIGGNLGALNSLGTVLMYSRAWFNGWMDGVRSTATVEIRYEDEKIEKKSLSVYLYFDIDNEWKGK